MIKLLWNTQNQKTPNNDNSKFNEKQKIDFFWGNYHKKSSDIWIYEILKNIEFTKIDNHSDLKQGDQLIIIDSSVEEKINFYEKLKLICSKIYLFHLGDESGAFNLNPIYSKCDFVWRTFCSNKYFVNDKVKCLPIGYKSGIINKNNIIRKYKWAFTGTPHKSSRHDLLYQFSDIKPFFCHRTDTFDKKIISTQEMSEVLSSTNFIPCPNGFFHPETYRLYEALECGCIPIVEDSYKYYDRLFPNNPFIKINKWIDAKNIIKDLNDTQTKTKQKDCKIWWTQEKEKIKNFINKKIING